MALSGPEALRALEEAMRDIRREEDEVAHRLVRGADLIARIRGQERDLLRQLAGLRTMAPADLLERFADAEATARVMLGAHADEIAAAEARLKALDAEINDLGSKRAQLQIEAARQQQALEEQAAKVRPALSQRQDYAQAISTATELSRIAEESLRKTRQAEADREHKGRPYRDDRLFMYLWERGYGNKGYRDNPVTVWLDGMVARLVGYAEARPNFAMLNEIPLRLREHAERQADKAHAAANAVVRLEGEAIDAAGGNAARQALERLVSAIEGLDAQMKELLDQRDAAVRSQGELAEGSDPAYAAAIDGLTLAVKRDDVRSLLAEARDSGGAGATLVQQIDDARQRANEEDFDTREQKARLKTLATRRRELENLLYEFTQRGFDNPRASFAATDLAGERLNAFLRGELTATGYWELWRAAQGWIGVPAGDGATDGAHGGWTAPRRNVAGYGGPAGGWGLRPALSGGGAARARPETVAEPAAARRG